ncbi:MAG: type II toxin-antitoxin system RelE/ParE family toxin [Planctomycetota bacterium]
MNQLRFTPWARQQLQEIAKFIAVQEQDLDTALNLIEKVEATCKRFAQFPEMGVARPNLRDGVRCFFVYSYVVVYLIEHEGIVIIDIFHSSQDLPEEYRHFFHP